MGYKNEGSRSQISCDLPNQQKRNTLHKFSLEKKIWLPKELIFNDFQKTYWVIFFNIISKEINNNFTFIARKI